MAPEESSHPFAVDCRFSRTRRTNNSVSIVANATSRSAVTNVFRPSSIHAPPDGVFSLGVVPSRFESNAHGASRERFLMKPRLR